MRIIRAYNFRATLLTLAFLVAPSPTPAQAQDMVVGVNVVNPLRASVLDQNTLLTQLKSAHVTVIRCGITNDAKGLDFAKRAAAQNIRIELIVGPEYPQAPPPAPTNPKNSPKCGEAIHSPPPIPR